VFRFHGFHGGMRRVDFLKIYGKSMNFDDCLGEIIMKKRHDQSLMENFSVWKITEISLFDTR